LHRIYASGVALIVTASTSGRKVGSMQKYDFYINEKKPGIGLYVRNGSGLPDFADASEWIFSGTAEQDLLPLSVMEGVEANGHAFRNMD
jgi:hypothetical protein